MVVPPSTPPRRAVCVCPRATPTPPRGSAAVSPATPPRHGPDTPANRLTRLAELITWGKLGPHDGVELPLDNTSEKRELRETRVKQAAASFILTHAELADPFARHTLTEGKFLFVVLKNAAGTCQVLFLNCHFLGASLEEVALCLDMPIPDLAAIVPAEHIAENANPFRACHPYFEQPEHEIVLAGEVVVHATAAWEWNCQSGHYSKKPDGTFTTPTQSKEGPLLDILNALCGQDRPRAVTLSSVAGRPADAAASPAGTKKGVLTKREREEPVEKRVAVALFGGDIPPTRPAPFPGRGGPLPLLAAGVLPPPPAAAAAAAPPPQVRRALTFI